GSVNPLLPCGPLWPPPRSSVNPGCKIQPAHAAGDGKIACLPSELMTGSGVSKISEPKHNHRGRPVSFHDAVFHPRGYRDSLLAARAISDYAATGGLSELDPMQHLATRRIKHQEFGSHVRREYQAARCNRDSGHHGR